MPRLPTAIMLALVLTASAVRADTAPDVVSPYVAQLSEQGYGGFTIGTTWLGRIVISASRDGIAREIVLNPRTGALLSDSATLPPAAERLSMRPDDDDDPAPPAGNAAAGGGTASATATVTGGGTEILDAGDAKDSAFGDGKEGAP